MKQRRAWIYQARSDLECGDGLVTLSRDSFSCHAVAKYQQAVEKAIKSLIVALGDRGLIHASVGWRHEAEPFMRALISLRPKPDRSIPGVIRKLFDETTRGEIRALDRLVPKRPAPGEDPARNTEYPYLRNGKWRAPSEPDQFAVVEVERFRKLAHRVVRGCSKLVDTLERA